LVGIKGKRVLKLFVVLGIHFLNHFALTVT